MQSLAVQNVEQSVAYVPQQNSLPWGAESVAQLVALFTDPARLSFKEIAGRLNAQFAENRTTRACQAKVVAIGLPSRVPAGTTWTIERCARLEELYQSQRSPSYSVIAERLNAEFGTTFSRNAVTGQVNRMGFANRQLPGGRLMAVRKPSAPRLVLPKPEPAIEARVDSVPAEAPVPLRVIPLEPRTRGLSLIALEANDCRYPHGGTDSEPDITFCGHPQHAGSSYCLHHKLFCSGRGTASERAAARPMVRA